MVKKWLRWSHREGIGGMYLTSEKFVYGFHAIVHV